MRDDVIGAVDIGGTKILVGLVNTNGDILDRYCFKTIVGEFAGKTAGERCSDIIAQKLVEMVKQYANGENIKIKRVGIACAGPVDPVKGTVENPYTLQGFEHFNIVEYLGEKLKTKVYLDNDVNGSLLGEIKQKKLEGLSTLMVSFGTGIGVAFYDGNELYKTKGRFHPEMGHQIIDSSGEECYCGNCGCFESLCSGTAINKRSRENGYENFDELMKVYLDNNQDEKLNQFIKTIKRQYKSGIWNLLTIFKPQILILGGGFADCYFDFLNKILIDSFDGYEDFVGKIRVEKAYNGAESTLIGASMLG